MPKNYISISEFAERNDMSVESIKRNFNKIPGAEIIDDEYWILESSRYPFNVGNTKLDRRENKQYVLLKATSQFKYIDEKMLKMPKASFETLIKELIKCGLLQKNHSNNPYGANNYDTTAKAEEVLSKRKNKAIEMIEDIMAKAVVAYIETKMG